MTKNTALIDSLIAEAEFSTHFSEEEQRQAKALAHTAVGQDSERVDCRHLDLVTIDDDTAHDFDDAVACQQMADGTVRLTVAIADVSAYVRPDTALDRAARQRGNSIYLPDRVLPMLPTRLSNDLCSLNPKQDRLAMVCDMAMQRGGVIQDYRFYRAIIRSAARMTYTTAAAEMRGNGGRESLKRLAALAEACRTLRQQSGSMMLENSEDTCRLDADGHLHITKHQHNIAHWAIEEAMLAANRCAADFLIRHNRHVLHRAHPRPGAEDVRKLKRILSALNIGFPPNPKPANFADVIAEIALRDAGLSATLLPIILGTFGRALYTPNANIGHFGLTYSRYLHFTSPIRRYPDLLVHRALAAVLDNKPSPFSKQDLVSIGEHCSDTESKAKRAERDCRTRLLCVSAQKHIGRVCNGYVQGFLYDKFFVWVEELELGGAVLTSSLPGSWRYDARKPMLRSQNGYRHLLIGHKVKLRLTAVVPDKGHVRLTVESYPRAVRSRRR